MRRLALYKLQRIVAKSSPEPQSDTDSFKSNMMLDSDCQHSNSDSSEEEEFVENTELKRKEFKIKRIRTKK